VKPLLLIRHDRAETFGVAIPTLEAEGHALTVVDAWDGTTSWPRLNEVSAVIEFGGEMNVDDTARLPSLSHERALAAEALERGLPYLGSCLGAQILVRALDRPVFKAHVKEIGFTPVRPAAGAADDPILSLYGDGDMVFHWHEDTFELPPGAELLATGDLIPVQAFRVGPCAWGLQFHFEIDRAELETWLDDADAAIDLETAWGKSSALIRAEADRFLTRHEELGRAVFRTFAGIVRRNSADRRP
jgi:GMP synthase (glutamine-hydrolysing)